MTGSQPQDAVSAQACGFPQRIQKADYGDMNQTPGFLPMATVVPLKMPATLQSTIG